MLRGFVRRILCTFLGFWLCGLLVTAKAGTYQLTDGTSLTGDVISYNDDGIIFRTGDDKYTDRIQWTKLSQDALKALAKDPKIDVYADPFIEPPPPVRTQTAVHVRTVSRLELPPQQSVIGALFSSSLGIVLILLLYAANIYAGAEVAIFRARPVGMVAIISAVLPILGPIIFLCMPTYVEPGATEEDMQTETGAPPEAVRPTPPPPSAAPGAATQSVEVTTTTEALHVAATGWQEKAPALPETQVFQRGQFTFNRRFFETKFAGFFGMTRHGADKDMVLLVKTPRAQHNVQRISRIAANEVYLEVATGAGQQEVMVAFAEIQEIQLKHKDA
jgi:hypothetical protein